MTTQRKTFAINSEDKTMLKAGIVKVDITPPIGIDRAVPPSAKIEGICDNLYSVSLVLDNGKTKIALITADLCTIDLKTVNRVRSTIREQTGIKEDNIMICVSHTHSSPTTSFWLGSGNTDEKYLKDLEGKLTQAVCLAVKNMFPARVGMGVGQADNIGINRHIRMKDGTIKMDWQEFADYDALGPAWPKDSEVGVVRIDSADGKPAALLVNFGCHAVCMDSYKNMVSADFPGHTRRMLEKNEIELLYTSGLSGDINPIGYRDHRGPELSGKYGETLGNKVLETAKTIRTTPHADIKTVRKRIELPLQRPYLYGAPEDKNMIVAPEIQIIRINNLDLIALPFEIFTEIGLDIKKNAVSECTFVVSLANGYYGYLPAAKAWREKGIYETEQSPSEVGYYLTPEAEEILKKEIEHCQNLVRDRNGLE